MARKKQTFQVEAEVIVLSNHAVVADTLEEAIVEAEELTVHDFVKILGDHMDSRITIVGVSNSKTLALYRD